MYSFTDRLKNAWSAFTSRDPTATMYGQSYINSVRPDRRQVYYTSEHTFVKTIQNRIAVDVSSAVFHHGRMNDDGSYFEDVDSNLNEVLQKSANTDQTGRAFIQDLVMSMFEDGVVAAVPVITSDNPAYDTATSNREWDILALRVGQVLEWQPTKVKLNVYNDLSGKIESIILDKSFVAIIENPFYAVMNEPNSTLKRLTRTLRNVDKLNSDTVSSKLNLLVQLPYSLRSTTKQQQAEIRRKELEHQLTESKYGIGYIDQAEKIVQLNKSIENDLWTQAQDLTATLYNQLGLTQSIFDGTATETAMTNYYSRTVEPILSAIAEEMERKFLTEKELKNKEIITYVRDPFKNISITNIAQVGQAMISNEVMSSNELRTRIGLKPRDDKRADELINKQINKVSDTPGENMSTQHKEQMDPQSNNTVNLPK